jgi:hypoxanthine phosphoribosyltransferase
MSDLLGPDGYPINAERPTLQDIDDMAENLAGQITAHHEATGEQWDYLGIVARGGYVVGSTVARLLHFNAPDIVHFGMTLYPDGQTFAGSEFRTGDIPVKERIEGKDILVIEEVVHTGATVEEVERICELMGVNSLTFAALYYKQEQSSVIPKFYVKKTEEWIVFPYETHEKRGKSSNVRRKSPEEIERINARLALQAAEVSSEMVSETA